MMKPIMGIELDDSSHNRQKRLDRDNFVNDVFGVAGLPLARVKASPAYNLPDLKKYLSSVYHSGKAAYTPTNLEDNEPSVKISVENSPQTEEKHRTNTTPPTIPPDCPKCGISLVVRKSRSGELFYGCSNYPKCKVTLSI